MPTVADVACFLEAFAPSDLAEAWDNVGLLVGENERPVERLMTCLTITPASAAEAIDRKADLIVTHHPLPFRPLKRLTGETPEGRVLLPLIAARVAIYSPHTAFDSASQGINQQLAEGLGLKDCTPLVPAARPELGAGRIGRFAQPITLAKFVERTKKFLGSEGVHFVGAPEDRVQSIAVACGSAGELAAAARDAGCDCMVTGEARFHTCLEAASMGLALVLAGHFASERFAVVRLAEVLAKEFAGSEVWASREETDPIRWR